MGTFADAIKREGEKPANTIRLIVEGKFLRAYNESAWLFQSCITEHKVVRKYIKSLSQDVYFIGFPMEKFLDTIGSRKADKTDFGFDVALSAEEMPAPETYATWLQTVAAAAASKAAHLALPLAGADAQREVIRRLQEYPLERKTPIDNTYFLAELRQLLSNK